MINIGKKIGILFLIFNIQILYAQDFELPDDLKDYYRSFLGKTNQAYDAFYEKDYDKAIQLYEEFFADKRFKPKEHGSHYFHYADALLASGDIKKACTYFKKSVKYDRMRFADLSRAFYRTSNFKGYEVEYDKLLADCKKVADKNYIPYSERELKVAIEINKMIAEDQLIRGSYKYGRIPEFTTTSNSIRAVDSANLVRLMELIDENPDLNILGYGKELGISAGVGIMLIHGFVEFPEIWEVFFEPYYRKRLLEKKGTPSSYAFYYDRIELLVKGNKPYYGVGNDDYGKYNEEKRLNESDMEEINIRREKIGLPPIKVKNTEKRIFHF